MRFAAVALFAGAVMAQTITHTAVETVLSCAPEVTDCPGKSTQTGEVPTGGASISTTATGEVPTAGVPTHGHSSSHEVPVPSGGHSTVSTQSPPKPTGVTPPTNGTTPNPPKGGESCAVSTWYEYSTVVYTQTHTSDLCTTGLTTAYGNPPTPTGGVPGKPGQPGTPSNGTSTTPPSSVVTAGAAHMGASLFAAAAGVAAVVLA